jgi:hypothetical protein
VLPPNDPATMGQGNTWRINKRINDDCTHDVEIQQRKELSIEDALVENTTTRHAKRFTIVDRNQDDDFAEGEKGTTLVGTDGTTIRLTRSEKTPAGQFDKTTTETEPVHSDTDWVEYETRYGTAYFRRFRNADQDFIDDLLDDYDNTTSNSLSLEINDHDLFDGVGTRMPYGDQGGGSDTFNIGPMVSYRYAMELAKEVADSDVSGTDIFKGKQTALVRYIIRKVTTQNRNTYGGAEDEITDWAQKPGPYPESTGINPVTLRTGRRLYQAFKVEILGSTPWQVVLSDGVIPPPPAANLPPDPPED